MKNSGKILQKIFFFTMLTEFPRQPISAAPNQIKKCLEGDIDIHSNHKRKNIESLLLLQNLKYLRLKSGYKRNLPNLRQRDPPSKPRYKPVSRLKDPVTAPVVTTKKNSGGESKKKSQNFFENTEKYLYFFHFN